MTLGNKSNFFGEIHTTVGGFSQEQFVRDCNALGLKCIFIKNLVGDRPYNPNNEQMMTVTRFSGPVDDIINKAKEEENRLRTIGWSVIRSKVELKPTPSIIYQFPEGYWEIHLDYNLIKFIKGSIPSNAQRMADFNLWRQSMKLHDSDNQEKLVLSMAKLGIIPVMSTARIHDRMSYESAMKYAEFLTEKVKEFTGSDVKTVIEYCIYDTNEALDDDWIN